jgi:hypothetical protein
MPKNRRSRRKTAGYQVGFGCCFCGAHIEPDDVDITGLAVISNYDKLVNQQKQQILFCHYKPIRTGEPGSVAPGLVSRRL